MSRAGRKNIHREKIQKVRALAREFAEDDPTALEAEGIVLQVMRGEIPRNAGVRLGAAAMLLERARGKPVQPVDVAIQPARRVALADGNALPAAATALPTAGTDQRSN